MKIAAICPTWNSPHLLGRVIKCFEMQTYENRVLLILDDAGQYPRMRGDRWELLSGRKRFTSLGRKRNMATQFATYRWPDIDAFAVWDDDDIFLPHHLEACVMGLKRAEWTRAHRVLIPGDGLFKVMQAGRNDADIGFHSSWAWRRDTFEALGGYAEMNTGEDHELAQRTLELCGPSSDNSIYPTPSYCYNTTGHHLSAMGKNGYKKMGREHIIPTAELDISWPFDYSSWPVDETVLPRSW